MSDLKHHVGFYNVLTDTPTSLYQTGMMKCDAVEYRVINICQSSNGKVVAFATSPESAEMIVKSLNTRQQPTKEQVIDATKAIESCLDIYMRIHVSEMRGKPEYLKKAWFVGQEIYTERSKNGGFIDE